MVKGGCQQSYLCATHSATQANAYTSGYYPKLARPDERSKVVVFLSFLFFCFPLFRDSSRVTDEKMENGEKCVIALRCR